MGIKGIEVVLIDRVKTGVDDFNRDVYEDVPVIVENVLVYPSASVDALERINLSGNKTTYNLCIPKGDQHEWAERTVMFFGKKWKTVGDVKEYIEDMLPLAWNKQIMCERYE